MVKEVSGPVLHVFTQKGTASNRRVKTLSCSTHPRRSLETTTMKSFRSENDLPGYKTMSDAIYDAMHRDQSLRADGPMCEGNKLGRAQEFPQRFFDTGICEAHTVALPAGWPKRLRPIVNIYSTFLQRSFDHIFQESHSEPAGHVLLDRGGLAGPDGPTSRCLRQHLHASFPERAVMAPATKWMCTDARLRTSHNGLRHPISEGQRRKRQSGLNARRTRQVGSLARGEDGMFVAFGALFPTCVAAAERLREEGLDVGVINARFAKPIDRATIFRAIEETGFVITVEENSICGGFGSAVLEAANAAGVSTNNVKCMGIPDRFIEHGERDELLSDIGLDLENFVATALAMSDRGTLVE